MKQNRRISKTFPERQFIHIHTHFKKKKNLYVCIVSTAFFLLPSWKHRTISIYMQSTNEAPNFIMQLAEEKFSMRQRMSLAQH